MKYLLFPLLVLFLFVACKKETTEDPVSGPMRVLDQNLVETQLKGNWKGSIEESSGSMEDMEVIIEAMELGQEVASGTYSGPNFSCGFEWTYEKFIEGKVTFREKTLAPNICFDDVTVIVFFNENDFSVLHVQIPVQGLFFSGTLDRQ